VESPVATPVHNDPILEAVVLLEAVSVVDRGFDGQRWRLFVGKVVRRWLRQDRSLTNSAALAFEIVPGEIAEIARINPSPSFSEATPPPATPRSEALSAEQEKAYLKAADEIRPVWFQRIARVALETALDVSSILRLVEGEIDFAKNEIRVIRSKTHQQQIAPLTKVAREIITAQLADNARQKVRGVRREQRRIFSWDYDIEANNGSGWPITPSMVQNQHDKVCERAGIVGYWFRDHRHTCATKWAENPSITPAQFCAAMGWSQSAGQYATYINLKAGSIGKAFKE
jgi:integrase